MKLKQVTIRSHKSSEDTKEFLDLSEVNLSEGGIYNDLYEESTLEPFKELRPGNISDVDMISRVKIIRAPDLEMSLKAVAYFENYAHIIDGEDKEDFVPDLDLVGGWVDSTSRIPIISWSSLQSPSVFHTIGSWSPVAEEAVAINNTLTKMRRPYYETQKEGPIIIRISSTELIFYELSSDVLERFPDNRIYLLITDCHIYEKDENVVPSELMSFIVDTDAAIIDIYSDKEPVHNYYKTLAIESISDHGMTMADDFPLDLFVDKVMAQNDFRAKFIEKLLRRHKSREGNVVDQQLFKLLGQVIDAGKGEVVSEEELFGMEPVLKQIDELVDAFAYSCRREKLGLPGAAVQRVVAFVGKPGTAKTTVASLLAAKLAEKGLLPDGRVRSMCASEMQGVYLGETSHKVTNLFSDASGGSTLFLDEAYSIAEDIGRNMYAREAIATLCIELEKVTTGRSNTKLVILAGYGGSDCGPDLNLMQKFIDCNPGIRSRIAAVVEFPSATAESATGIFEQIVINNKFSLKEEELEEIRRMLKEYFTIRVSSKNWGSGRESRQIFTSAVKFAGSRLVKRDDFNSLTAEEISTLVKEDVFAAIEEAKAMHLSTNGKQISLGY